MFASVYVLGVYVFLNRARNILINHDREIRKEISREMRERERNKRGVVHLKQKVLM